MEEVRVRIRLPILKLTMIFVIYLQTKRFQTTRNYQTKHFSFNVDGGRCEVCKGDGEVTIEMQFMADVHLECEACNGKRFKKKC